MAARILEANINVTLQFILLGCVKRSAERLEFDESPAGVVIPQQFDKEDPHEVRAWGKRLQFQDLAPWVLRNEPSRGFAIEQLGAYRRAGTANHANPPCRVADSM